MNRFLVLPLLFLLAAPVSAQPHSSDEAVEVQASITALFDAMRAGDSTGVRQVFAEGATLQTAVPAPDSVREATGSGSVAAFADAVGRPKDRIWDERIWDVEIRVDGPMASAWVPYAFYLGDDLQHCGVNAIQLIRQAGGWKLLHLVDTRTPAAECDVPEAVARP